MRCPGLKMVGEAGEGELYGRLIEYEIMSRDLFLPFSSFYKDLEKEIYMFHMQV